MNSNHIPRPRNDLGIIEYTIMLIAVAIGMAITLVEMGVCWLSRRRR